MFCFFNCSSSLVHFGASGGLCFVTVVFPGYLHVFFSAGGSGFGSCVVNTVSSVADMLKITCPWAAFKSAK